MNYNNINLTPEQKQAVDEAVENLKKRGITPHTLVQIEACEFPREIFPADVWERKIDSMKDKSYHHMLQSLKKANLIQNFASGIGEGRAWLLVLKQDNIATFFNVKYYDTHPVEQGLYQSALRALSESRKIKRHLKKKGYNTEELFHYL